MKKDLAIGIILLFIGTSIMPPMICAKPENIHGDNKAVGLRGQTISLGFLSSPTWTWAKSAGDTLPDVGYDVAVDIFGNTYITGIYWGSITFGDFTLTSWCSQVFVAKQSSNGVWLWATCTTGVGNPQEYGGIAVDMFMNVYITGDISGSATFGNTTIEGYQGNVFVAKLNRNGVWQWAVSAGREQPKLGWAMGMSIAVDYFGCAYVTGLFQGKITFGKTTLMNSGHPGVPGNEYSDVFVVKVNSQGVWRWATGSSKSSSDDAWGCGIAVDFGRNVYVTGFFYGALSFNAFNLTSQGGSDVFVAKFNPRGVCQWVTSAGGLENDPG